MFKYSIPGNGGSDTENSDDYYGRNGGIFEIISADSRFKALNWIFEGDYFSLYPTIIVAYNISIETLVPQSEVSQYQPN